MKAVSNLTRKPLKIALDHGRFLHLGPNMTGQVPDRAAERPAFLKMVERGEIEVDDDVEAGGAPRGPRAIGKSAPGGAHRKAVPSGSRSGGDK